MQDKTTPHGYCECGCGDKTRVSAVTDTLHGYTRGEPLRFIHGHNGTKGDPVDRVLARIEVHPLGCWEFTGALQRGYGVVGTTANKTARAHRVVYEAEVGPIPPGMTIDHLCLNTRCVNPAHLEVVSRSENARRQAAAGRHHGGAPGRDKTHCPQGHEYDGANTHRRPNGWRTCRACSRERARARREGKRASG